VNILKASDHRHLAGFVAALSFFAGAAVIQADDAVPSRLQTDEQISVWVDDASLSLFIVQLASITGREATIQGDLTSRISGRFNGSLVDTLAAVGEQFGVLFDLDEDTLGAVPYSDRSSATIALGSVVLDEPLKTTLAEGLIAGNRLDIRESEVVVSGHPSFVSRQAKTLISAIARPTSEPGATEQFSASSVVDQLFEDGAGRADLVQSSEVAEPVLDAAAPVILDEAAGEIDAAQPLEAAAVSKSAPREIRWVTDIPGYETF